MTDKKEKMTNKKPAKKKKLWQKILIVILAVIAAAAVAFGVILCILTAVEYSPEEQEDVEIEVRGEGGYRELSVGDSVSLLTWNIGYGALGDNADFFMDGGKMVQTADKNRLRKNLDSIESVILEEKPDVLFLQEIDRDSLRSHRVDEYREMQDRIAAAYEGSSVDTAFACNYDVLFVPYPLPPLGKVESGIATFAALDLNDALRYRLPCPFDWPVRVANLKRCLLITRVPVKGSGDRELVLINLHLEAYDSGEGKIAQTQALVKLMQQETDAGNYVIVGGDFNQTFSSVDTAMYPEYEGNWQCGRIDTADFSEEWQFIMDNSVPTCRSLDRPLAGADTENFQFYMIDGFIVSGNVHVDEYRTMDCGFVSTDHNPVSLKVTLE